MSTQAPNTSVRSEKGIALVIVLLLLAVMMGLTTGMTLNGQTDIAMASNELNYAGARGDGSTALNLDGQPVASHFFGQSSFASHAITLERNVVKVDAEGLELSRLGPLACGLQTGAGSVMRSFDCRKGSTIAIFGGGPVGLAAVMAAALRHCARVIAIEPIAARRELALEFGASDVIDPANGDVAAAIRALLPDGVDFALETSGREAVMETALGSLASHGVLGLVGVPSSAESTLVRKR